MAKMTIEGLDDFIRNLERAQKNPEEIVKKALYEGAGVVADAVRSGVAAIPVSENKKKPKHGVTRAEKAGLLNGIGISKMRMENAAVSVVIGFNGVNEEGRRNTTVMRRLESGTSTQAKYPVVRPATKRSKASAQEAMQKVFVEEMKNLV